MKKFKATVLTTMLFALSSPISQSMVETMNCFLGPAVDAKQSNGVESSVAFDSADSFTIYEVNPSFKSNGNIIDDSEDYHNSDNLSPIGQGDLFDFAFAGKSFLV